MKNLSNFSYTIMAIVVVLTAGLVVWIGVKIHQNIEASRAEEQKVLAEIAARIGTEENWLAVREYVYCEVLIPGKTRENIERDLSLVWDYSTNISGQGVYFKNEYVDQALGPISVFYDNLYDENRTIDGSDKIVDVYASYQNHEPKAWCELGEPSPTP